ncbi:hypothetical protein A2276_01630 [candidate division WOR-1 bacterium RIFOXYA12_FULL_43_27]|uniref:tRNA-dihydrouridine synthase n=1 Tax=candidate division WOR-1 bacterium RIFOXYC2_FULL_46_14 TaxID=1802587 RepID=A0A1F4U6X9_UNCSA|nr:MAG: hypothetical protein A2276_01630 [candidate division WOR-1 bacterium RIFOXYA12_FULL_43_27]OGC19574.1 MAG: hypothetical protein A2292_02700 [candidate division WOR-1 bacterium RIFOXYB2_FULL_46_45]OGC30562.1 MAG: hypothetical protein A2232_02700 [candidate division WOR-1 bacterium RIFOXYA2_FULL_46_56]OGC40629.1 MAG: hypothetical protein A2438_06415 [candidate division WOR-1 bacterium RIFOXYC2_FULL_46_14]
MKKFWQEFGNTFLAPLSGCSDLSFRLIAREHGAKFCFYEMVDANALLHQQDPKRDILKTHPDDKPIAAQLLGSNPDQMLEAAKLLLTMVEPVFLDINAACPAKKILKKKCGAYFAKNPTNLFKIIEKLSSNLSLPITVKLRIGFDRYDEKEFIANVKNCEKAGASALFVHGRTMKQGYSGTVNYEAIKKAKAAVKIPLFGSGDILNRELMHKMLNETGCDGVLVARGALGNPWFFSGETPDPEEKKNVMRRHLAYLEKYKKTRPTGKLGQMKKTAMWYLKEFRNTHELRRQITNCRTIPELLALAKII